MIVEGICVLKSDNLWAYAATKSEKPKWKERNNGNGE